MSPRGGWHRFRPERGTALLAALCFAAVLAVALGSYLSLCYRTLALSTRSLRAMHNFALAETGMEEALWALNNNNWTDWTITGTTATKTLGDFKFDGGVVGGVAVTITNYTGSGGVRGVTVSGSTRDAAGGTQRRTFTAVAERAPLLVNAVAATTGQVRFRAAGSADSYNSSVGDYDAQTPGFSAVISSGSTSTTSATVQIGNALIKGFVATMGTGPSSNSSGELRGPIAQPGARIDATRISTSPYQPVFDEVAPSGSGDLLPAGTATLGAPAATSPAFYYGSDCVLAGTDELTVAGPVVLVLSGNLMIADTASIRILGSGSLRIHVHGNLGINGGGIRNDTKLPRNLVIISTTNPYESYGMATDTPFHGVIYTPISSLTVSNDQAIYGAIVARSVTFLRSPSFHYDVSLRTLVLPGVATPFGLDRWRETYD